MWTIYEKHVQRFPVADFETEEEAILYQDEMRTNAVNSPDYIVTYLREEREG